ncbi:MAG: hypothetical protein ABL949_00310 [Fimbriimonadaceae bacterium]
MTKRSTLMITAMGACLAPTAAHAQIPDLVSAFDAGGRAMGMGGATNQTGSETLSAYYNPAGLGYLNRNTVGLSFRNKPQSKTVVTGDIAPTGTQFLSSQSEPGPTGLGHAGIAIPLRNGRGGNNGVIAVSLTAGGQLRDERTAGSGLTENGLGAANYRQLIKSDTEFINVSYGRATGDGSFSWGLGLVYAINRQINQKSAPSGVTDFDAQATGIGGQVGVVFTPKDNPDLSVSASYRTPIKLKSGGASPLIFEEVPGRLAAGVAIRRNGFRGARDYMVLGVDVTHFFDGKDATVIDRDPQTVFGLGVEYNYSMGTARIPVRLGYNAVPAGGRDFGRRNAFTFGLGYRPNKADWGVDLNWAKVNGGGNDFGISLSYKFGN